MCTAASGKGAIFVGSNRDPRFKEIQCIKVFFGMQRLFKAKLHSVKEFAW
jgi:hypothetical protein